VRIGAPRGYEACFACRRSRDNSKIVSGGDDKQAILWDVGGEAGARKFRGHVGVCR
jgi:hypothetical protein